MNAHDIRELYLNYFKDKGHKIVPSASILPENDPTTLFTGSGMQPMVPYLLGESHPGGTRITDSQKCIRTQDIEEVGDNRHTTFFEMLGNWSLGDYFKQEQIPWMFDFLTNIVGLDPKNLYITCFRGNEELQIAKDVESAELWKKLFEEKGVEANIADFPEKNGMQDARIFYYDESKNWWSRAGVPNNMPVGEPGGPDTEMFWDFGGALELHKVSEWKDEPCHVNCDCGRFLEIGNNVFMEYQKTENGFVPLSQKNVDFGGGLERIAAAKIHNPDIFMTELFTPIRTTLEQLSGKVYGEGEKEVYAFRVIMDHLRGVTFMILDGAEPSNKDQGYFTRRMLRRAIRFIDTLGIESGKCTDVIKQVIDTYKQAYPALQEEKERILNAVEKEEEKFRKTLSAGMKKFTEITASLKTGEKVETKDAFDLYQSFGFPFEITKELAEEGGFTIDEEAFKKEMQKHQNMSREGAAQKFKGGMSDHSDMSVKYHTATHLLHAALLEVLGPQATQKGSNITPERLRFDFVHGEKLTDEEKKKVEDLVNAAIKEDYSVSFKEMTVEEAKEKGAIGLFGDKYGDKVKVYTVGDPNGAPQAHLGAKTFSRELCGGPHVEKTGTLGTFKIKKEKASSAGIRRIRAILE
ncbi:MAG: alanine--tRNA ligase [Candidatus Magasanikbacteria bacterium]|jgi:alanyl-tRNA synthetase|nr:alanine--tRNA ligase [Candidatus Magasanikbacteria bacterium]MBT4221045.1 alanine--tRNA ligase [Candidatus Magasanikbacteria bacterium]MBT4350611.1 alanine--tRNA ligase [Candidatus Magasanikbacteria bacterium]MBT4542090.1 alanine--tRNA ligase [Candidatus Magasanikbacteria bacterium]MBT6253606.1 alanine--tRNA ligase [Candidatus Magasanikbacteria bacterium]